MNTPALDALFARRDDTTTRATPAEPPRQPDAPDFAALADLTTQPDTSDTLDALPPSAAAAAQVEALIASGALDAHIERIVRHILAESDTQQNIYTRRAGGYRPGVFGSIG